MGAYFGNAKESPEEKREGPKEPELQEHWMQPEEKQDGQAEREYQHL